MLRVRQRLRIYWPQDADMIIRYQSGCNAGHTVVVDNEIFKFHLIPSGILYKNKICMIGPGTVIYPNAFKKELDELIERGVDVSGLKISPLASVTMPYNIDLDRASENSKKYLNKLENLIGAPITIVSVGSNREQTIILKHQFKQN